MGPPPSSFLLNLLNHLSTFLLIIPFCVSTKNEPFFSTLHSTLTLSTLQKADPHFFLISESFLLSSFLSPFFSFSQAHILGFLVAVMMVEKLCCFQYFTLCGLLLAVLVSSEHHGNSANDLVDIINKNRTAQKLPQLSNSPGLGCIALQYAEECMSNCSSNNSVNCHPSADDFTEIFAPNCGVELPTFGTISGYILGCQPKYLEPLEAFSNVLVHDKKSLSLLRNKTHTEVGVGIIKAHKHKGPYLWCILFSSSQRNTIFVLDDLGEGIKQKKGCYSGTSFPCSRAHRGNGLLSNKIASEGGT